MAFRDSPQSDLDGSQYRKFKTGLGKLVIESQRIHGLGPIKYQISQNSELKEHPHAT